MLGIFVNLINVIKLPKHTTSNTTSDLVSESYTPDIQYCDPLNLHQWSCMQSDTCHLDNGTCQTQPIRLRQDALDLHQTKHYINLISPQSKVTFFLFLLSKYKTNHSVTKHKTCPHTHKDIFNFKTRPLKASFTTHIWRLIFDPTDTITSKW